MRVSFYFGIAFVGLFASEGRDSYYGLPKDGRKKAGGGGKKAHRDGNDIDNQQWQVLVDVTVNRQSELPPPQVNKRGAPRTKILISTQHLPFFPWLGAVPVWRRWSAQARCS